MKKCKFICCEEPATKGDYCDHHFDFTPEGIKAIVSSAYREFDMEVIAGKHDEFYLKQGSKEKLDRYKAHLKKTYEKMSPN